MKKKILGAVYGACLVFIVYYLATVLQRQPEPGPVWPGYAGREDALVEEIISLLPEPGAARNVANDARIGEMIGEASLESIISLLVRMGYLEENLATGDRIQVAEKLVPLHSSHVVLLARKLHKSRVRGGALVSVGELLSAGTRLGEGAENLDLYLTAYEVYGYKKTRNRVEVLNEVLQGASAGTTLDFLRKIQLIDETGDANRIILATLPMSTLFLALSNLERTQEPERAIVDNIALGSIQPGNEAADLRGARMLAAVATGSVKGTPDLLHRMVDRCDGDVIESYLRLAGYVTGKGSNMSYRPEVLVSLDPEQRIHLADKLAEGGYIGPFRQRAIGDLRGS